ncbi:hypothetical protein ACFX2F_030314 [Malus domestica]
MGAICCLVKAELPLHQGLSQNDDRKGQTFFRGGEERRESDRSRLNKCKKGVFTGGCSSVLWNKINASIKRRNQRGAPQRGVLSQIEESGTFLKSRILFSKEEFPFSKAGFFSQKRRSFLKSWACSETTSGTPDFARSIRPDVLSPVTRKLSSAKITGSLSNCRFQPSVSLSLVSTCHMQLAALRKLRAALSESA